jgi:hypothetical protein
VRDPSRRDGLGVSGFSAHRPVVAR